MPNNLHDGLFKATFSQVEHAAGELRAILPPALVARLDFSTLTLCPGSFVDRWGDVVREAWDAPDGVAAIRMIFRCIFEVDERLTVDELKRLATTTVGEDIEEEIVTLADRLREEGRQKGERTGERKLLLKQLTLRFGTLPDAALARVNAAGVEQLEAWAERVLTALTLAEVIEAS